MRFGNLLVVVVGAIAVAACSSTKSDATSIDAGDAGSTPPLVAARPYHFKEPAGYDPKTPTPLVVLLHGYGAGGIVQQAYLGLNGLSDSKNFLLAYPDGTLDSAGKRFWNATDGCCNFDHNPVDDVAYVGQIIDDVSAQYNVNRNCVSTAGVSAGALFTDQLISARLRGSIDDQATMSSL